MTEREIPQTKPKRLFLALWPDEALRSQLADLFPLLRGCGGRKVPLENLHITLAFLGSVDADTQACLERAIDLIDTPSFPLEMDQLGFWRRPQVVWLGAEEIPPALAALVGGLKQAMISCGLEPESRPFQAHLTLMRKAWRPPLEANSPKINWPVKDFALVASETLQQGARYEVLRKWRLKGYY